MKNIIWNENMIIFRIFITSSTNYDHKKGSISFESKLISKY
ncbi:hypothetical protein DSAG12_04065 [Promethearchaeum syntrophicum]|uniref:Uncharacterized protein n=1 Tax=Promethearchaeum syntrophicum TaxID=2594042 RepID=A0AC61ZTX1_9ARCH|nr:hypothetical protein [Candidatus Prometheoarchaeum syntrophicum]